MKLGAFNLHGLSDGSFMLDGGQMFGVVPKTMWEKKISADAKNRIRLGLTCLLIQTGKHNIVVETGIGDKYDAKFENIYQVEHSRSLPGDLQEHGLRMEDIDIVINTHLHFDHCGWNVRREGGKLVPGFPRARYFIQRGEWEDAHHATERNRASYLPEFFAAAERQSEFLDGDVEIVPGVRVEVGAGHTRWMQCVRVESEGQTAYFPSDLVPTNSHLGYAWMTSFDLYPLETLANKKRFLPELAAAHALLVFAHDPCVPWARLVNMEGKISTLPVEG
jgi:glyoxylase-like metal-dependent hydrolase (beta-lactamase superfamily II)